MLNEFFDAISPLFDSLESEIQSCMRPQPPHDCPPKPSIVKNNIRVNVKDTPEAYVVEAEMPGVKKENISVDVQNDFLIISAKTDEVKETVNEKEKYVIRERRAGSLKRSFSMKSEQIDVEKISAKYEDGVLYVIAPKKTPEEKSVTHIEVT